jgi:endonuclease/exonuclease/phosphatase family metal-dependent hydrolase
MGTDAVERDARASMVLVALLCVVVAQVVRVLFPVMFEIGEDWDFVGAAGVALAVFAAPVVAVPLAQLGRRAALVTGSAGAGGALVVAPFLDPIAAGAAIALVAVALVGGTLVITRLDGSVRGWFVFAVLVGLAMDVAVRALARTWDLPWQDGAVPRIVGVILAVGLLVAAVVAGRGSVPYTGSLRPAALVVGGALAALELLFLTNIGFVAAHADLTLALAAAVVLVGLLVAVLACAAVRRVQWPAWMSPVLAVIAVAIGWILPTATGLAVLALVVVLQAIVWVLYAQEVGQPPAAGSSSTGSSSAGSSPARVVVATTGGSVLFLVIVLLWQLHIDQPLPFPRQAVAAVAVAVVALPALRRSIADTSTIALHVRPVAAAIAALAVVVPVGLWATSVDPVTDPVTDTSGARELRLVSYNTRGAVDVDGQLRPDRVAAEILTSDPDVVVLQEVGRGWPIHSTLDLLAYLSRELDMEYAFAPAADGQFGNAILSGLPMEVVDSGRLPDDGSQDRSYLVVELTTATGPVTVVGTHLHTRSVPQITAVLDAVGGRTPVVVAGDMNMAPTDPEVALFTDSGLIDVIGATGDPCRTTSAEPTSSCDRPDWVFVSPDIGIEAVRIGDTVASDHLAIHASLNPG